MRHPGSEKSDELTERTNQLTIFRPSHSELSRLRAMLDGVVRGAHWPDPPTGGGAARGCIVTAEVMPWLADTDVGAAHGFARALFGARTVTELRRRALSGLAE